MDKTFWQGVASNDYQIPESYTLAELGKELFSCLASTDPELRDETAYIVYANWMKRGMYSVDEIRANIAKLLANIETGIGETDTDTVFLRSFSALLLAETVHNDNKKPFLSKEEVHHILDRALAYLMSEQDPRGYVPVKGWAHALAHTADLLMVLGRNRHLDAADLGRILDGISEKLLHSSNHLYIHGEDERLANAILQILGRCLLPTEAVKAWIKSLLEPKENSWQDAFMDEARNRAFQNTRNLLRSVYLTLIASEMEIPERGEIEKSFLDAAQNLSAF
ncbi:MAG: DUF2785 domain-containing protein [Chloroflexota bacterium]